MLPFTRWTCWISKRPVCPSPRPSVSGFVCQRVCLTKYGNNEFRGQYPSSICGISSEDDGDRYHVPLSPPISCPKPPRNLPFFYIRQRLRRCLM